MRETTFTLPASDGTEVFARRWSPDDGVAPRAVMQVSHGMAEHGARYAPLAEAATARGIVVYASDHRGHGQTIGPTNPRGHFADRDGWRLCLDDLNRVGDRATQEHPGLPRVLFAHSMGSFMAQQLLFERGDQFAAVLLSGSSSGVSNPLAPIGRLVARVERKRLGARTPSPLLTKLSFGTFNKPFEPARTDFDWLSRDPAEVDKYIADPLCGFDVSTQLWVDLLDALPGLAKKENLARIPKATPLYVVSGSEDPVHTRMRGLKLLLRAYEDAGLRDVTWKVWSNARHEVLNETNRAEVIAHALDWVESRALSR
ncbi:MAG: alpha/beta hydrolase [Polyangiales bacterium]